MKQVIFSCLLFLTGCASYPNYYIKDSTITSQQQTTQPVVAAPIGGIVYGEANPVFYTPPVFTTPAGGGWWGGGGWGGGWGRGWGGWGGGCW